MLAVSRTSNLTFLFGLMFVAATQAADDSGDCCLSTCTQNARTSSTSASDVTQATCQTIMEISTITSTVLITASAPPLCQAPSGTQILATTPHSMISPTSMDEINRNCTSKTTSSIIETHRERETSSDNFTKHLDQATSPPCSSPPKTSQTLIQSKMTSTLNFDLHPSAPRSTTSDESNSAPGQHVVCSTLGFGFIILIVWLTVIL